VKDGYRIVRCEACSLLRREDLPPNSELVGLYGADYFAPGAGGDPAGYLDYLADEELHRLNARRRLSVLDRFGADGPLLDVGCAAGFFIDEARRRGWTARGVDVSRSMVDWAREALDLSVVEGTFSEQQLEPASFATITMWDYIEHSRDPVGDVARAAELLRPGGLLALSTGDSGSLIARVSGSRWHLLTPRHHLFFFDRMTLRRLLATAHLEIVDLRSRASRYSLRYLAHKLRTAVDVPPLKALDRQLDRRALGARTIPVDLHDIVTVVVRKPR
jgi:SAM-dependent methyltransferase